MMVWAEDRPPYRTAGAEEEMDEAADGIKFRTADVRAWYGDHEVLAGIDRKSVV